jgi:hypothetical protein
MERVHLVGGCVYVHVLLCRPQNPIANLLVGGTAGIIAASACYPLDTIRRRMQVREGGASTRTECVRRGVEEREREREKAGGSLGRSRGRVEWVG